MYLKGRIMPEAYRPCGPQAPRRSYLSVSPSLSLSLWFSGSGSLSVSLCLWLSGSLSCPSVSLSLWLSLSVCVSLSLYLWLWLCVCPWGSGSVCPLSQSPLAQRRPLGHADSFSRDDSGGRPLAIPETQSPSREAEPFVVLCLWHPVSLVLVTGVTTANTTDGAHTADAPCPLSWRLTPGMQEWAGGVPRGHSPRVWTAVLPLGPHRFVPSCVSVS